MTRDVDVVVAGGGQAGLAAGYHLRRLDIDFTVLDAGPAPGGAWQHMWDSLHLFSPAGHGDRTGPASATLIGVGRPASEAARRIARRLDI